MPTNDKKPSPNDKVYLLRRLRDGALKIGTTSNLRGRIGSLGAENNSKFELIAAVEGSYELERELCLRFQEYAIPNKAKRLSEWFHDNDAILDYALQYMRPAEDFMEQRALPEPRTKRGKGGGKKHEMVFRPKVAALVGKKMADENRRITLPELTAETGVNRLTLYYLLRGNPVAMLNADTVYRLCGYFNCTLSDLVDITPAPAPASAESEAA